MDVLAENLRQDDFKKLDLEKFKSNIFTIVSRSKIVKPQEEKTKFSFSSNGSSKRIKVMISLSYSDAISKKIPLTPAMIPISKGDRDQLSEMFSGRKVKIVVKMEAEG
jgi:hypothetical protein